MSDFQDFSDFFERVALKNNSDGKPQQYDYTDTDMIYVLENPEEYIIPEELPACKMLWEKGIETYECGNYGDEEHQGRWIAIQWNKLSEENKIILDKLIQTDSRYSFGHFYKLTVPFGPNATRELCDLVEPLQYQENYRYKTAEQFLDEYKRQGGEVHIGSGGEILHTYNPDLIDDTLETALKKTGKEELYDKTTNRVYNAKVFLEWHNNYVRHTNDEWQFSAHMENGVESHRIK